MKYFIYGLIVAFFSACGVKTMPPLEQYTISVDQQPLRAQSSCQSKSIKILQPVTTKEYMSDQIIYNVGALEQNHYNNAIWSVAPYQNIYKVLVANIRQSGVFQTVLGYNSLSSSDYILEIEIEDFKQYFSSDLKHSYVKIALVLSLVDRVKFQTLKQKRFFIQKEVSSLDVKGGVEALNEGFKELNKDIVLWLSGVCNE